MRSAGEKAEGEGLPAEGKEKTLGLRQKRPRVKTNIARERWKHQDGKDSQPDGGNNLPVRGSFITTPFAPHKVASQHFYRGREHPSLKRRGMFVNVETVRRKRLYLGCGRP